MVSAANAAPVRTVALHARVARAANLYVFGGLAIHVATHGNGRRGRLKSRVVGTWVA